MKKGSRILIISFFILLVGAVYSFGFSFLYFVSPSNAYRFQSPSNIPYRISSSYLGGNSSNIQAVRNAFGTWDANNTSLNFSEVGSNEKIYVYSQNQGGGGVLAYTQPYISGKTIYYCYVNFNSYYSWSTNPSKGQYDIERVAVHEFGHVIGLDHPDQADDQGKNYNCSFQTVNASGQEIMNSTVASGTQSHSLTQDELCARDYLYPYSTDTTAPATVSDLSWSKTSSTMIDMVWTAPGDDGYSGTASSYDIRWSNSPINSSNFSSANSLSGTPSPVSGGTTQHLTVSGFSNSQLYYFAMKATDDYSNTSGMSNVITVDLINPAAVSNLTASNPTINSIKLQWTAAGDDGNSGTASSYDLRYSTSSINASNFSSATQVSGLSSPQSAGATETFTVTGLAQGTTYYFALKVSDEVPNTSSISNVVSVTTQKDSDGDGLSDTDETNIYGTNPYDADTDDDSYNDGVEVKAGTNPLSASSYPAEIRITVDNNYILYVNGTQIGSDGDWTTVETYYANLQPGGTIAIQGTDAGWIAGIACQIKYGTNLQVSDFTWQVAKSAANNWQSLTYDHSSWGGATETYKMGEGPWGTTVSSSFDSKVNWIWTGDAYNDDQVYLYTTFDPNRNGMINFSTDNNFELFKNGTKILTGTDWSDVKHYPTSIAVGDTIAVDGKDEGGIASVIGEIIWKDTNGNKKSIVTDGTWKLSTNYISGWEQTSYNDSGWGNASISANLGDSPWGSSGTLGSISSQAKWIWASDMNNINEIWLRKTITNSTLTQTGDNSIEIYVNGIKIGEGGDWSKPQAIDINLQNGDVIAVKVIDQGGMGGFLGSINYNGTLLVTNPTWKGSRGPYNDLSWTQKGYDDSSWTSAISKGSNGISPWGTLSTIDSTAQWIWVGDFENEDIAYFRFTIGNSNTPTGVTTMQFTADDHLIFYLNGERMATNDNWSQPQTLTLTLKTGDILAFEGEDKGYKAGLLFSGTGSYNIVSDTSWKISTVEQTGWNTKTFNDSAWSSASDYGAYGSSPWGTNVSGFTNTNAHWIWSGNNTTGSANIDTPVYFRKVVE
ncbi:MAG: fibronectin type III domain-containing protein [Chlamydiae bacterium]|nr:fibronectin type III domain-containing protein [Chlamydiota bacterium]MBI3276841.1 fibronectin type III domain-containing protein [Chlamydiota bacterium]